MFYSRRPSRVASSSKSKHQRRCFLESLEDRSLLASVTTDKLDYTPGSTALITATGYQVGEAVKFQVLHTDGTPNTGNGHLPWTVIDGGAGDLDGVANGNVKTSWYVDPDDSSGSRFQVTALGLSSNLYAAANFTDTGIVDFKQAANDIGEPGGLGDIQWINSILQSGRSKYFE